MSIVSSTILYGTRFLVLKQLKLKSKMRTILNKNLKIYFAFVPN